MTILPSGQVLAGQPSLIRVLVIQRHEDTDGDAARHLRDGDFLVAVVTDEALSKDELDAADVVIVEVSDPDDAALGLVADATDRLDGPAVVVITTLAAQESFEAVLPPGTVDYVPRVTGYGASVPGSVERAFWRRALARRTEVLRDLVALVDSSADADQARKTLVRGATTLLEATAAVLAAPTASGRSKVLAAAGDDRSLRALASGDPTGVEPTELARHQLAVPLPTAPGGPAPSATLFVERSPARPFTLDERSIATTYAALAGSALQHLHRSRIESGLIEEMQRTLRVRHDLVASVSHELRTPLTAIGGYADVLLRAAGIDPDRQHDFLTRIRTNADRLERLVDEMILIADLERGRRIHPNVEKFDLAGVVQRALVEVESATRRHTVDIDVGPVEVIADAKLVRRIIGHLVTNAAKYAPAGTTVRVRARTEPGRAVVSVSDEGPGIPAKDSNRIFDPFWRGEIAVAQAIPGTGLGLTLVREYVGAMGGVLSLAAQDGGATFEFTLPLQHQHAGTR